MYDQKHTSGPWLIDRSGRELSIESSEGEHIALILWPHSEEDEANAHLISAVPELLEVVKHYAIYSCQTKESYPTVVMRGKYIDCKKCCDNKNTKIGNHCEWVVVADNEAARIVDKALNRKQIFPSI